MGISFKSKTRVKSIQSTFNPYFKKTKMSAVNLRVPRLYMGKWVYEYPSFASLSENNSNSEPNHVNSRNSYREIPIQTEKSAKKDWRGPWPCDNLGPKPRLVGGKLIKPKLIDY